MSAPNFASLQDAEAGCAQMAQLLTASRWGVELLWQKDLISLETLEKHAIVSQCIDPLPSCVTAKTKWLSELMSETLKKTCGIEEKRRNGILKSV